MTLAPDLLAVFVAVGPLGDPGSCAAWIESADRRCGKPAPDWLCPRHVTVATRRAQAAAIRAAQGRARALAKRDAQAPARRAELARIEARLAAIDPPSGRGDRAEVNLPLARRIPSDARIEELALLHKRREAILRIHPEIGAEPTLNFGGEAS